MRRVVILGAGGRGFHKFNVVFRDDPEHAVVGFTCATDVSRRARQFVWRVD